MAPVEDADRRPPDWSALLTATGRRRRPSFVLEGAAKTFQLSDTLLSHCPKSVTNLTSLLSTGGNLYNDYDMTNGMT